jgi:hypothetical protein
MEMALRCWLRGACTLPRPSTDGFPHHQTRAPAFNATKQVRSYAADAKATPTEVSSILEQRIRGVQEENSLAETGRVLAVGYATKTECRNSRGQDG